MWISSLFRWSDVCAWYGISCDATDGSCLWSNKNIQIVVESLNKMPPGSTLPYFISSKVWCIEAWGPFTVELEERSFSWFGSLVRMLVCSNLYTYELSMWVLELFTRLPMVCLWIACGMTTPSAWSKPSWRYFRNCQELEFSFSGPLANGHCSNLWLVKNVPLSHIAPPSISHFEQGHFTLAQTIFGGQALDESKATLHLQAFSHNLISFDTYLFPHL